MAKSPKRLPHKVWDIKELNFLYQNYKTIGHKEIGRILNRNKMSIDMKLYDLGLRKREVRELSNEKSHVLSRKVMVLKLLRQPDLPIEEICEKTGLSWQTIYSNYLPLIKNKEVKKDIKKRIAVIRNKDSKSKERWKQYYMLHREELLKKGREYRKKEQAEKTALYRKLGIINAKTGKPY